VDGEFELVKSLAGRTATIEEQLRAGGLIERVAGLLSAGADKLKTAVAATGAELNKKFAADGEAFKGEMGFGGTKEFYAGLEGIVGSPKFLDGSLLKSMEQEHCGKKDAERPFDTSNGIKGATSKVEWEFVVSPDIDAAARDRYPERGGDFRAMHPGWCRKPRTLDVMEEKMQAKNLELERAGQTKLIFAELIGGMLYSGPCYEKYNAVLRFHAAKNADGTVKVTYASIDDVPFLQKKCGELERALPLCVAPTLPPRCPHAAPMLPHAAPVLPPRVAPTCCPHVLQWARGRPPTKWTECTGSGTTRTRRPSTPSTAPWSSVRA